MHLLSTTYFGPVQWYQKLNAGHTVYIEACETYAKQTFRNRCVIATANGTQALTVPVERPADIELNRCPIRDLRISDHGRWRQLHWNALQSAYSESSSSIMPMTFVRSLNVVTTISSIIIWR